MSSSIGKLIRNARADQDLTQEQAAKKAGLSPNTWARIERGEQEPKLATLKKAAKALSLDVSKLL